MSIRIVTTFSVNNGFDTVGAEVETFQSAESLFGLLDLQRVRVSTLFAYGKVVRKLVDDGEIVPPTVYQTDGKVYFKMLKFRNRRSPSKFGSVDVLWSRDDECCYLVANWRSSDQPGWKFAKLHGYTLVFNAFCPPEWEATVRAEMGAELTKAA